MKSFAMTLLLKDDPETIEKYKEYHRHVWPEVERSLKAVGIISMQIFLLGRRLFLYMGTADDFEAERDFPKYLEMDPRCKEWDALMCTFQEKVQEAGEGEWWAKMARVYNLV